MKRNTSIEVPHLRSENPKMVDRQDQAAHRLGSQITILVRFCCCTYLQMLLVKIGPYSVHDGRVPHKSRVQQRNLI